MEISRFVLSQSTVNSYQFMSKLWADSFYIYLMGLPRDTVVRIFFVGQLTVILTKQSVSHCFSDICWDHANFNKKDLN